MVESLPEEGIAFVNWEDENVRASKISKNMVKFGLSKEADYYAKNINITERGSVFEVVIPGKESITIRTKLLGKLNILNIVCGVAIADKLGLSEGTMIKVALILVYSAASGTGFYVAKGFFDTIPKALDEAALLDGANKWQIFTRITIPLSRPILVYTALSSFLAPWVDFIFARVICRADASQYTVSIGMWRMLEYTMIDAWYTRFAAAAVCVSIPIAILFVVMQKFYAEGMSGAVKG